MKNAKKLLALLMALVMILVLAACDSKHIMDNADNDANPNGSKDLTEDVPTDEEQIVGTWVTVLDVSDSIEAVILSDMPNVKTVAPLNIVIEASFTNYGEFRGSIAYDEDAAQIYRQELSKAMIDFVYEDAQQQGLSKQAYDEWFATTHDTDLQTFVTELVATTVADQKPLYWESAYRIDPEEGVIYTAPDEESLDTSDDCFVYQLEGDQLTLDQTTGSDENVLVAAMGLSFPWEMERQ